MPPVQFHVTYSPDGGPDNAVRAVLPTGGVPLEPFGSGIALPIGNRASVAMRWGGR